VTDARQVRAIVQAQAAAGWPYIKVYTRLTTEMFDSVIVAAKDAGIPALGHVPFNVDIRHALESGMKSIEHFTGYDRAVSRTGRGGTTGWIDADPARYPSLVAATVAAGAWNCPTLAIYSELSKQHTAGEREAILRNRRAFVRAISQAGGKLLVGTDAGIDIVAPGTSIHDELREFVAAGLTPFDALRGATTSAAEFLGRSDLGRVVVGARADLLLLEANPLSNIENSKRIDGIVLGGAWRPVSFRAESVRSALEVEESPPSR
jgi:imidazolonepropionase-like amidohydrolase